MNRRHATLAATLAGLTLLAAGCGGGGGSSEASTTPTDAAALLATDVAATPGGLTALGVTAPDLADARLHAYGTFGTPANVFKPRVAASAATTAVPVHRGPGHDRSGDRHDAGRGHHDADDRGPPRPLIPPGSGRRKTVPKRSSSQPSSR